MLFSIVVPVYNVEKYLDECLQSILKQVGDIDYNCEVLLIDDGSTDGSGKKCDDYSRKYPEIIKVFHKANQGLLATRRYGYQRTSGEYIINCDSDDLFEHNMLVSIKNVIEKYENPDIIFFNHYGYDGKNKTIVYENIFGEKKDCIVSKEVVLREYMRGHSIVSVCGKIVKHSCIDADKDYNEFGKLSTGEDTLQSIEFFSNATTFVYLNEPLYDYRYGSGMTAKFDSDYYFTFKRIFEQIEKEKYNWNLCNFNELFAIKVLQTAGRAITQSRYNKWNSVKEQTEYLKQIRKDEMFINNIGYLKAVKTVLQWDHVMLLSFLEHNRLTIICLLLRVKNVLG